MEGLHNNGGNFLVHLLKNFGVVLDMEISQDFTRERVMVGHIIAECSVH